MAIGDIIDIGGRAYMEVQASNTQNEDTSKTYALVTQSSDSAAFGKPSDAPWSGTGDATVISLLKKIALNTTP